MEPIHKPEPGFVVTPRPAVRRARRDGGDEHAFDHELEHASDEHPAREGAAASREEVHFAPPDDDEAGRRIDLTA
jgi:hypothetical protein